VIDASKNNNWTKADAGIGKIQEYQKTWGKMLFQMNQSET
jgi:hypothetical protein